MASDKTNPPGSLETKLEQLYGEISPDPKFARDLRRRIVEKALEMVDAPLSHSQGLGFRFRTAWGWILSVGALAVLAGVLVFSMRLLPERPASPGMAKTTQLPMVLSPTVDSTPLPTLATSGLTSPAPTETPAFLPADQALAPDACNTKLEVLSDEERVMLDPEGDLPQMLAGGGKIQSGYFAFEIWLACDPSFSRKTPGGDRFSEIDGLGVLATWRYDGPDLEGTLTEFAGFEPFVSERGGTKPVGAGSAGFDMIGLQFPVEIIPDFSQQDTRLRYVVKEQTPDGVLSGAALAFTLQREAEGYRPVDIQVEELSAGELQTAQSDASMPLPFPTQNPDERYPELKAVRELLDGFYAPLRSSPGWVHVITRREEPEGNGLYGSLAEWLTEEWLQIDARGFVVAFIHTERTYDGRVLQQTIGRDGKSQNLTYSLTGSFNPYRFDPGADLYVSLLSLLRSGRPINRSETILDQGPVWTFTFGDTFSEPIEVDGVQSLAVQERYVIDKETGAMLLAEMVRSTLSEDEQLVWRQTYQSIERADAPPDEVTELLGEEAGPYMPLPPEGTPAPPGFDPSKTWLTTRTIMGDDFDQPTYFYGDIYAGGYLLGRVDFGGLPDGGCDRSADGLKLAFTYQMTDKKGFVTESGLRWLDLRDVSTVHKPAPELRIINRVVWSPAGEQIAFSACLDSQGACGLYLYDLATGQARLLTDAASTIWDIVWKPDGSQLAFVSMVSEEYRLFNIDAARGDVLYQGIFDIDAWQPSKDAPINEWGVSIPRGYSGSRCFQDFPVPTPEEDRR